MTFCIMHACKTCKSRNMFMCHVPGAQPELELMGTAEAIIKDRKARNAAAAATQDQDDQDFDYVKMQVPLNELYTFAFAADDTADPRNMNIMDVMSIVNSVQNHFLAKSPSHDREVKSNITT